MFVLEKKNLTCMNPQVSTVVLWAYDTWAIDSVAGGNMSIGLMFSHGWEPQSVAGLSCTSRLSAGSFGQTMCPIVTHEAIDRSACHVYLFSVCKTFMCVFVGSGKRPQGYQTWKITNGKAESCTNRLSWPNITVGWNEEKSILPDAVISNTKTFLDNYMSWCALGCQ